MQLEGQNGYSTRATSGPLRQLEGRLTTMQEDLASVRASFTASTNSLIGEEAPNNSPPKPSNMPPGLVGRLNDSCDIIQDEITRLDELSKRLGGLL